MMRKIICLGCGENKVREAKFVSKKLNFKKFEVIGVDKMKLKGVDIVHDLNTIPYPLKDGEFDAVTLFHVLEHLENTIEVLRECYRILKRGGSLFIKVPHFSSASAYGDLGHKHFFSTYAFIIRGPKK